MTTADSTASGNGGKRALLARLLTERASAPRSYPVSFGQQRLWFLDRFTSGVPVYNIPVAYRVHGPLDVAALRTALTTIVNRHGALRTTFSESGGEPVQVVRPTGEVDLTEVDLTGLPTDRRDAEATRLVWEQSGQPFDLARGPLLRVTVVRTDADRHHVAFCVHHIVSDAWSLGVIFGELVTAYAAASAGTPARLPDLPTQYADFAVWQRDRLAGDALRSQLDYWVAHLRGAPALLSLPTDRPRPTSRSYRGACHYFTVPAAATRRIEEFNRDTGVTMFMTLLAAFQAVLSRHSGQDDIVIGTPVAGREHPDLEQLVGFFVNTLALRVSSAGSPSLRQLVQRVREVTLVGLGNAEVPFERVVEELQPERSLAHAPIFQAQIILQNTPDNAFRLAGCTTTSLEVDSGTAKFDLTLVGEITAEGALRLAIEYDTALFDASTVDRLARHLCTLLDTAVADPDRPLTRIPLLSGVERWRAVVEWNQTDRGTLPVATILDLLPTDPAEPGAPPAVTGPDGQLDRAGLHRRAGRIARRLLAAGVAPDTPVGICVDRGVDMVAAVLGVWRAGAGYLPLDPTLPPERLRHMLADSGTRVVLTQRAVVARLGAVLDGSAAVLLLDDDGPLPAHDQPGASGPDEPVPAVPVHPDGLAYLIYTSGSTGRPKGVAVPHRCVVNLVASFHDDLDLTPADRFAAVTTLSFDISVLELLVPLLLDVPLLVVGADEVGDGTALRRRLTDAGITAMQATPATWRLLLASGGVPSALRLRLCGGEALPRDLADALLADGATLWNCYGPTETTVWSAAAPVSPAPAAVDLGAPIANTRIYLLDESHQPVPVGVVGEIHIGGSGVVRGYHGRPGLTAGRFVPDPFADQPGARLYATGDLARQRADGRLEFLGRADHQVKVRGFRIELGEIEALLRGHDLVADAVVSTWAGGDGDTRLVAYAVPVPGVDPDSLADRVRPGLAGRLPEYMLPAALVPLTALPLTDNGKVDRNALPAPRWTDPQAERVAPRDPLEQVLAGIWQEVLRVEGIGVHDDFFRLGGHSLLGAQALSRIAATLETEVPIRVLFEAPTIATMAGALRTAEPVAGQVDAVAALRQEVADLSDEELRALLGGQG
ncbi:amino acid adenylation domain-containing protein [Micromonospora nigra]|uniref:Amino acid adenylation domain-containing protein n=1 Tax=Micromonospora nigra TaxID=145857 RepID=A0A1C6RBV0_9ACTN|nr:non-ribosomal peptide synthetase [Micromonospora nigra]SCL14534.1 amino acid adenylation domain-containing protein [Micromonospora nigra]